MSELASHTEQKFFSSITSEISFRSSLKMVKTIRLVVSEIMRSLSYQQVRELLKRVPGNLQLLFAGSWKPSEEVKPITHLDELVENVLAEAGKGTEKLLTDDVQALRVVLLVMKYLLKELGGTETGIFSNSLAQECLASQE